MQFTDSAKELLKRLEACKLEAYPDEAGVWTIGYGHTGDVHAGMVWTQAQADAALDADLAPRVLRLQHMLAGVPPLSDNRFSALVIFVFNVGLIAFAGSTAFRDIYNGRLDDVPAALALWNKIHDRSGVPVVSPGLVKRRAAEAELWNTPAAPTPTV